MRPDEVKGIVAQTPSRADRYFYLLDKETDEVWETDGYRQLDGETGQERWMLLIMCPKCRNELKLETGRKQFEIDERGIETAEPFRCSWPIDQDGYKGACPWGCELQRPGREIKVPVRLRTGAMVEVKIDAMIRQVK